MRSVPALLLTLVLVTGSQSCSSSSFSSSDKGSQAPGQMRPNPGAQNESKIDSDVEQSGKDVDDQAEDPAPVSGAFLTCVEDTQLPGTSDTEFAFGCTVVRDGQKLQFKAAPRWELLLFNEAVATSFTPMPPTSAYHIMATALRDHQASYRTRLIISKGDLQGTMQANIASVRYWQHNSPLHLGDNQDLGLSLCRQKLQSNPLNGDKIVFPITVESNMAVIAFSLLVICGIDLLPAGSASILSDGQVIKKEDFQAAHLDRIDRPETEQISLKTSAALLSRGHYTFEINSVFREIFSREDFYIGKIEASYAGAVKIGEPLP